MSWKTVALGDVCKVIAGQSPEGKYYNNDGNGLPFYQGKKDFGNVYIKPPSVWTTEVTKVAIKEDILMSVRAPVGPVNISTENICIGRGLAAIRASEKIDKSYLFNFLLSMEKNLIGSSGAVFNSINKGQIEKLEIPLPSLVTQQKIVAKLDAIFAEINKATAAAETNAKNAEALFNHFLSETFESDHEDWEKIKLSDLCNIKHGYAFEGNFFSSAGEYVLLTPGNFYETGGYRDRLDKQKYFIGEIPKEYVLKKNDLLVAMTEQAAGLLGSPILVPADNKFLHNQRLGLIAAKDSRQIHNNFMFHIFNLQRIRKEIHNTGTGLKVRHTSPTKIGQITIQFPRSMEEQISIAEKLDSFLSQTKKIRLLLFKKIQELSVLRQAILKQAFNGELVTE